VGVIHAGDPGKSGALHNFCLSPEGNVLACYGGGAAGPGQIRVFNPDGKLLKTWAVPIEPQAICVQADGTVFVGGTGRLLKLDPQGQVIATVDSPARNQPVKLSPEMVQSLKADAQGKEDQVASYTRMLEDRRADITGMAASGQDLFVACPSPSDFSYSVYRLDTQLQNPVRVVEGLRGCCGQMDIQARDGKLWIPHNARHRVECRDRDGKELSQFGRQDRKAADGFGGCCEPKNLRMAPNGDILAAESGPPVSIKRFSPEGKFLGVVALPNYKSNCVRVTVDVSADGRRFFILSTGDDTIHVLEPRS
jgi:hypothetical protein